MGGGTIEELKLAQVEPCWMPIILFRNCRSWPSVAARALWFLNSSSPSVRCCIYVQVVKHGIEKGGFMFW